MTRAGWLIIGCSAAIALLAFVGVRVADGLATKNAARCAPVSSHDGGWR